MTFMPEFCIFLEPPTLKGHNFVPHLTMIIKSSSYEFQAIFVWKIGEKLWTTNSDSS